jgi:hypothetical protein
MIWVLVQVRRYDLSAATQRRDEEYALIRGVVNAATAMWRAKPKHIVTACIAIRGLPPDNGGEQCFGR